MKMAATKRKAEKVRLDSHKKPKVSMAEVPTEKKKPKKTVKRELTPPSELEESEEDVDILDAEEDDDDDSSASNDSEEMEEKPPTELSNDPVKDGEKSKKAHHEQKKVKAERQQAKPYADLIAKSKKIWEKIRQKKISKSERKKLIEDLKKEAKGHIKDLVFKHDASRVVQTVMKYGDVNARTMIAQELKGTYVELSQSSYGKYLVVKTMHYGSADIRTMVIEELYGNVRKLVKHREACYVVDDAFREYASRAQKVALLSEFYGIEYAIFKNKRQTPLSLKDILANAPEKRSLIMKSLFELISAVVAKGGTFLTILHAAMLEFISNIEPGTTDANEFVELVKEKLDDIAFTKDGAQVVMRTLAMGSAKDRKVMIKTLKPVAPSLARHESGYLVLVTILDLVDDTVLVSKSLVPEFQQNLPDLAMDKVGRVPLLYPFVGRKPRLLQPSAIKLLEELDQIRKSTSKKDPEVRQLEHRTSFSPMLLASVTEHMESLARDSFGCQFVTEIVLGAVGVEKTPVLTALAALAEGDPKEKTHIAARAPSGRMLKTLVAGGHFNPETKKIAVIDPPLNFGAIVYPAVKDHIIDWATGSGSFVVVGLLEADNFVDEKPGLLKALKKASADVKAAAENGNTGAKVILSKVST